MPSTFHMYGPVFCMILVERRMDGWGDQSESQSSTHGRKYMDVTVQSITTVQITHLERGPPILLIPVTHAQPPSGWLTSEFCNQICGIVIADFADIKISSILPGIPPQSVAHPRWPGIGDGIVDRGDGGIWVMRKKLSQKCRSEVWKHQKWVWSLHHPPFHLRWQVAGRAKGGGFGSVPPSHLKAALHIWNQDFFAWKARTDSRLPKDQSIIIYGGNFTRRLEL